MFFHGARNVLGVDGAIELSILLINCKLLAGGFDCLWDDVYPDDFLAVYQLANDLAKYPCSAAHVEQRLRSDWSQLFCDMVAY